MPTSAPLMCLCACLAALAACSPQLNWREVRAEGGALAAMMPCKPDVHERSIPLVGKSRRMQLQVCSAAEATWAIAWIDVDDPAQVGAVMSALRESAAVNLSAVPGQIRAQVPAGATPQAQAGRSRLKGSRPDGRVAVEDLLLFAHGLRVYQATVIATEPPESAVDTFFADLRLRG